MKKLLLSFFILFVLNPLADAQVVTRLLGSSPFQDSLWSIDTTTWGVRGRIAPSLVSGTITGMTGLTQNPVTKTIYAICKVSAVTGRVLCTYNPLTGVMTQVGNLGDNFSSLAFTSDQKLYATTGNGATVPEALYQIDTATAAKRLVKNLGNGVDGEIICWNTADNMLYHWSGNGTIVYEKFDTVTGPYNFTNIPIIGTTPGETFGMVCIGPNKFIGSNISSSFNRWYADGTVTPSFGSNPDDLRGLVLMDFSRSVTATSGNFCAGDSTLITSGANRWVAGYQWYKNGVAIPGATSRSIYANASGFYNCMVSDAAGTDSSGTGIQIIVNPAPSVNLGADVAICQGGAAVFDAGNPGNTYLWSDGSTTQSIMPTAGGTYSVVVTDAIGCTGRDTVMLTVNPLPVVDLGADQSICNGNMATFDAGNAGSSFMWSDASTAQTLMTGTSGTYYVTVTDGNDCMSSDTVMLTVNSLPVVDLGPDQTVCENTVVVLDAANAGSSYLWSDNSTAQTLDVTNTPGSYSVTVTDGNGCSSSDMINVTVNANPAPSVTSSSSSVCFDDANVTLTGSPAGGTYSGAGVSGNSFDPSAAGNGVQTVTYNYTDANGCSGSGTTTITVSACVGINEASVADVFFIYPNPASSSVNLDLAKSGTVNVYDATGRLILSSELTAGTHQISTANWTEGFYMIHVVSGNNSSTQRLIISR